MGSIQALRAEGRRERKKAATRQSIADAALELFLRDGFDAVSVRDVADRADVSTTTVFKHFAGKEALVFDRTDEFERQLVDAVRLRPAGRGVLDALREHALAAWVPVVGDPALDGLTALVERTPALQEYSDRLWRRHASALAPVLARALDRDADDVAVTGLARFVAEVPILIGRHPDPRRAAGELFDLLEHGWRQVLTGVPGGTGGDHQDD